MKTVSHPDAIRCSIARVTSTDPSGRLEYLTDRFSGILRSRQVYVRNQGNEYFLSANPSDSILEPTDHRNSGGPRYNWIMHEEGVFYGYLNDSDIFERVRP